MRGEHRFTAGGVLARSFSVWLNNLVPLSVLLVLFELPALLYQAYFLSTEYTRDDLPRFRAVLGPTNLLLSYLASGAVVYGVSQQLAGRRAGMRECIATGLRRGLPVVGVAVVSLIASLLASFLLVVPGIMVYCAFWVAVPAAVVERRGIAGSLRRSRDLTREFRLQVFGVALVLVLSVVGIREAIDVGLGPVSWESYPTRQWIATGVGVVCTTLLAVAPAVGYHALRMVKEGTSIDEIASVFD